MNNRYQTNTFTGGMNLDMDLQFIPTDQYRYAENVRVVEYDKNNGVLQDIQDTRVVAGGDFIKDDETVLATDTNNSYGIILTTDSKGITRIYRLDNTNPIEHTLVLQGNIGYTNTSNVKLISNYESNNNIKIYFTDGVHSMKSLNIFDTRYTDKDVTDSDGNLNNPSVIDTIPDIILKPISAIQVVDGGSLLTGVVQYSYRLYNVRGTATTYAPVSNSISISSEQGDSIESTQGSNKNINSGKSVTLSLKLHQSALLFDKMQVLRIRYEDKSVQPTIEVIDEIDINDTTINFQDRGGKSINTITLEEFNSNKAVDQIVSTIEKKNNILFAANVTENTWNPDYDARAYSFSSSNVINLKSSSGNNDIYESIDTDQKLQQLFDSIPKYHDCINPYVLSRTQSADQRYKYAYHSNGQTPYLGGTGPNVSYRFVTIKLTMDDTFADQVGIKGQSTYATILNVLDGKTKDKVGSITLPQQCKLDYSDPYINSNFKGYKRDEVYSYGIVFYNKKSQQSPVLWIADIRMPNFYDSPAWWLEDNSLYGHALGLEFTVNNIPEEAVAYEIVRCERRKEDRTILMQGVLSLLTSFPFALSKDGDWIKTNNAIHPIIPLNCVNSNMVMGGMNILNVLGNRIELHNTKFKYDTAVLISPEIDYSTDDSIAADIKTCYLKLSHRCQTRFFQDTGQSDYVKCFINPRVTYKSDTVEQVAQDDLLGSFQNNTGINSLGTFIIFNRNKSVSNIAGKYYHMYSTGSLKTEDIDRCIIPPILEQNDMQNPRQFYRAIGNNSFMNIGVSWNDQERCTDGTPSAKVCYYGKCAVIGTNISNLWSRAGNSNGNLYMSDSYKQNMQSINKNPFDLPVVDIKTNVSPYGGNTYTSRQNRTYISTNSYRMIDGQSQDNTFVFGGDTYLAILDHRTASPIPYDYGNSDNSTTTRISISDMIPFETSLNLYLDYGENVRRIENKNFYNPYLSTTITGGTVGYSIQSKPYYAYNDAYSVESISKQFTAVSEYVINNLVSPNRIIYSDIKTNNELFDSWTNFRVANYLDVDTQYGPITNLKVFNNQLLFWQNDSFGLAAVNERSLVTDNIGELVLGSGGVLDRYDYYTTGNGSSVINDNSIVNSDYTLFWYDNLKNEICAFSNSVIKLSKEKNVQTFLNNMTSKTVKNSLYDNKYNEIQMVFDDGNLVYNERLQSYTSFYSFKPEHSLVYSDKVLYIKNNKIFENADFALNHIISKITYIVNQEPLSTKTYDNVFFHGKFKDIKSMFVDVRFTTKTQEGTINKNYIDDSYAIDYREDTYRFAIGRESVTEDDMSLPGRLKGKYLVCDYTIDCSNQMHFNLPNISTTYRQSLV